MDALPPTAANWTQRSNADQSLYSTTKQIKSAHFGNTEGLPALATIHSDCSSYVIIDKSVPFTKRPDLRRVGSKGCGPF